MGIWTRYRHRNVLKRVWKHICVELCASRYNYEVIKTHIEAKYA